MKRLFSLGSVTLLLVCIFLTHAVAQAPKRVIIDTDPGVDDAMAILLAVNSPELKVEALTVVPGNVDGQQGLENALKIDIARRPLRCGRRRRRAASTESEADHGPVLARQERPGRCRIAAPRNAKPIRASVPTSSSNSCINIRTRSR